MAMLETGKIDLTYAGHDPNAIFAALEAAFAQKRGEFESSTDFEERRAKSLKEPYLPGLNLTDQLAFIVEVKKASRYFSGLVYSYDVDSSETSLYINLPDSLPNENGGPNHNFSGLAKRRENSPIKVQTLQNQLLSERDYQASNAYGATVTVTRSRYKTVQLGLVRLDFVPSQRGISDSPLPVTRFRMESSVAAIELPKLKALFLVRPSPPFVHYNLLYQEPTIGSPTELVIQTHIIRGVADEIVFFSGITGKIIFRTKAS